MRLRFRYVSIQYGSRPDQGSQMQRAGWNWFTLPSAREGVWRPPTDVYETDDHVVAMMELAGLREEDVEVTIFNDVLVVAGSREDTGRPERVRYHEMGLNFGRFRAEIYLPIRVNPDCVEAKYENGFLSIWLPKSCQP